MLCGLRGLRVRFVPALFLFVVPALGASACGSSSQSSAGAVARFTLAGDAPPSFMDVPFPSDAYLANGKVIDPLPGVETVFPKGTQYLNHEMGKAAGFSRVAMAMFYVDDLAAEVRDDNVAHANIDPATLPVDEAACLTDTSSVYVIDLEADAAAARIPCRSAFHDDTHHLSKTRPVIAVGPARGFLLAEGHKYAAVITSRLKTTDGRAVAASADFAKVAAGTAGTAGGAVGAMYSAAYEKVKAAIGSALDADKAKIVSIAPYTTNDQTKVLFKLRESLEDQPTPPLTWDKDSVAPMGATKFARVAPGGTLPAGFTASLDDWLGVVDPKDKLPDGSDDPSTHLPVRAHDKIDAIGTAVFVANNYLISKPGSYPDLDHATFTYDAAGNILPAADRPTQKIWVTIATPTAPMPPAGYPTVIVQHGLNGSRAYLLALANTLASKGWIALAIDSVTFGARAPEENLQVDRASDYAKAPGAKYEGADGISDPVARDGTSDVVHGSRNGSSDLFGGLQNIGAIRDQFREAGIDTSQLVKVLRGNPDLSALKTGDTVPKIDPDRIAYMGDSLGAVEGIIAAAIEPHVKTWFMNVVGAGLFTELASHSAAISFQLSAAGGLFFGFNGDNFSESEPFVTMCQHIVDGGDPIGFAPYLVKTPGTFKGQQNAPKNILQTQVIFDEIVSNESNEAFMRAANIGLTTPNVGSNASLRDLTSPQTNPNRVPLVEVNPDASGAFHDTPSPGITAVAVQISPAAHGVELVRAAGEHQFAIPFAKFDTNEAFTRLDDAKQFSVAEDYRGVQTMMTRFFEDGFAGKAPSVSPIASGIRPPVRDYDEDGVTDDKDSSPADPTAH